MNTSFMTDIVKRYASFGWHRTGWAQMDQCAEWLRCLLQEQGAAVDFLPFDYPFFKSVVNSERGTSPGSVEMLYFCWTGETIISNPMISGIDIAGSDTEISDTLNALTGRAQLQGNDGLILSTDSSVAGLCGINRKEGAGLDFPTVLASPEFRKEISKAPIPLHCQASIETRRSECIRAIFQGPNPEYPLVVTTPVSGWFECAGERAAGLAIAITVAREMSKTRTVHLLLAQGHEIGSLGGYQMNTIYQGASLSGVLHIGSCVGNTDADLVAVCSAPSPNYNEISEALLQLDLVPEIPKDPSNPEFWLGEAQCWASNEYPMLSIAGQTKLFHTQADLPDAATNGQSLATAAHCLLNAAKSLTRFPSGQHTNKMPA
ncbi:hypothetical protein [Shimia sediminis]|uniref:hypothetical protein n=1 Tax=Shimia sediminis TaxID=2497945 RepID=UPI000F8F20BA|nr:hypothetical protein [Shimia sediminis]